MKKIIKYIETFLINPNYKIPTNKLIKILDKLSVAYKDISEEEQKSIINNVYDEKYSNVVFIAVIIALIIIFIFSEKGRKNIIKYCKKTIKKELKK